ncbi:MAG: hypothetical protein CMH63_00030 [Nanoarchaeota archaeon]|jgi:hypothetical protein|nr:hypothetical protein [Nanoarchaeota archaeon]|tara:strand:+ start:6364 stop:6645 length:282 start_codon:yes stop_codon:yes gene_type:complete
MPKTKEELEVEIEEGDREEDVYTPEGRETAEDDDTITNEEEGFMEGYEEGDIAVKCANCNKILDDDFIEREIDGIEYRFCSETCAETFKKPES